MSNTIGQNLPDNIVEITTDEIVGEVIFCADVYYDTGIRLTPNFIGPPGTGKTAQVLKAMSELAKSRGLEVAEIGADPKEGQFGRWITQAANTPEEALSGLPYPHHLGGDKYSLIRAISGLWPGCGPGLWNFDEPMHANYAQRFMAQLIWDNRIEEYVLPDGVQIVLTGNAAGDRAGVTKMWSHFQNRIMEFRVRPTVEGMLANFALPPCPELSVYLTWFPEKAYQFDAKTFDGPFPTGRTWDFTNTIQIQGASPIDNFVRFQGLLGNKEATEYRACYTAVSELPDLDTLFNDPETSSTWIKGQWENNPHVLCALSFVVLRRLQSTREISFAAKAIQVFEIASMEIATAFLAVCKQIDEHIGDGKSVLDSAEYAAHVVRNQRVITN